MNVSVIIPTMPGREEMLAKLISTIPNGHEIIVVYDEDLLLAAKRNKGANLSCGEYILFIDDDNYLKKCAIENMLNNFNENIGVMGMVACYDDKHKIIADGGSKRNYLTGFTWGVHTNHPIRAVDFEGLYEVDEVANAFMMRRDVFKMIGGFDEVNFPIDLDEADLCRRLKLVGYKIVMNPMAVCYHKSQTYSPIPNFRRKKSAYFLSRNIVFYQGKHLDTLSYWLFIIVFLPVRFCFYLFALVWNKNLQMIVPMMKGYWDGLIGKRENEYQSKKS